MPITDRLLRRSSRPPQTSRLAGVRTLVVGLGRFGGGVGVTQWLVREGAVVSVTDLAGEETLAESVAAIRHLPVTLLLCGHEACDLGAYDLAVVNPALIKHKSALFAEILRRGLPWTTEINFFCERCPAPVVAVTGSYGKSTTAAMLAHALERCKNADLGYQRVHLGGNIGGSLLLELHAMGPADLVVLEMSNAQLEDIGKADWEPAVAVVTNLFPHHLDRYANFEGYIHAKLNLVRAGSGTCPVLHGELDPLAERMMQEAVVDRSRLISVRLPDFAIANGDSPQFELLVPGEHNQLNAACVVATGRVLGLDEARVRDALRTFGGLPHRLEVVGAFGGVTYINDSKSTAPAATMIAIQALQVQEGRLIVIVGGQKKDVALEECARTIAANARMAICYGEAAAEFAKALRKVEWPGDDRMPGQPNESRVTQVQTVFDAVNVAREAARSQDTILFSPGAPSFDQYANFVERGKDFVRIVRETHNERRTPDA